MRSCRRFSRRWKRCWKARFYQPEEHIFSLKESEDRETNTALGDAELLKRILEDIHHQDMAHLKNHFEQLKIVYHPEKAYSEMYVKFLFSSIIKEIYEAMDLPDEKRLSREIDRLYRARRCKMYGSLLRKPWKSWKNIWQKKKRVREVK